MQKKKTPTESQEQQRLVLKLRWLHPDIIFFAIPNGGKRQKGEAAKLKLEGVEKGTPDIFIAQPRGKYHGLFIELKRLKNGVVSQEQSTKMLQLVEKGYKCEVCYGCDDAYETIKEYVGVA